MHIMFRTDASTEIGTGHVMRCLTLANTLRQQGATCEFICRPFHGNLISLIQKQGFKTTRLPERHTATNTTEEHLAHAHWLGGTQTQDARDCQATLTGKKVDWLIVDHYALDARWQTLMTPYFKKLLVIDDLADRQHMADVLLDQNLGAKQTDYNTLVPTHCHLLLGPQYALLRPEFAHWRPYSLERRKHPILKQLLITLGGVDKNNMTTRVLQAIKQSNLPKECTIKVVMGATAPWLETVQQTAITLPWTTQVLVGVNNMAELMANSDLCIGAAGSTSWERCCLGLPTITLVLADNQKKVAQQLADRGVSIRVDDVNTLMSVMNTLIHPTPQQRTTLSTLSCQASRLTSGNGSQQVVEAL